MYPKETQKFLWKASTMKMYKDDGKERIPSDNPREVNLKEALREVDKFSTVEGNFVGFINEKEETIQFVRFEEDQWLIDVPIFQDGKFLYSLQDEIKYSQVKGIVTNFSEGKEWKNLCNLRRM